MRADGAYVVRDLAPGTYWPLLRAGPRRRLALDGAPAVTVPEGGGDVALDLVAVPGGALELTFDTRPDRVEIRDDRHRIVYAREGRPPPLGSRE